MLSFARRLSGLFLPTLADGLNLFGNTGLLLFPAVGSDIRQSLRRPSALEQVLNDPKGLGATHRSIISDTWLGPELLFRTDHNVLAAPFHMDASGNLDTYRFFSTLLPEEAKTIFEAAIASTLSSPARPTRPPTCKATSRAPRRQPKV